jgi:hypothetical protein
MKNTKIASIIEQAALLKDRRLSRRIRAAATESLYKTALGEGDGLFQNYMGGVLDYDTREHFTTERGGEDDSSKLYGVGIPDKVKTDISNRVFDRSLSTRYVPDKPGISARRIADGVYQDPITNKTYDWNEGFKTEDGETFSGGGVSLQTDIFSNQ